MTKKLLVFVFALVLLTTFVAADEIGGFETGFDNVGNYDELTQTMTITNTFGIGGDIATYQLLTPLNNVVGEGYQRVAEIEVNSFTNYNNALKDMTFFEVDNGMSEVERVIDYKYKTTQQVVITDYKEVCLPSLNLSLVCTMVENGNHTEQQEVWLDFVGTGLSNGQTVTLGIYTTVEKGDKIEWIPTYMGVEIEEWAVWTESLSAGLLTYYNFNQTNATNLIDVFGYEKNGSVYNAPNSITGIQNNASNFSNAGATSYNISNNASGITNNDAMTISFWMKPYVAYDSNQFLYFSTGPSIGMGTQTGGEGYLEVYAGGVRIFDTPQTRTQGADWWSEGEWTHICIQATSGDNKFYTNGTLNMTSSTAWTGTTTNYITLGSHFNNITYFNGVLDEFAVWNRNDVNCTELYNGGLGLTYVAPTPLGFTVTPTSPTNLTQTLNAVNYFVTNNTAVKNGNLSNSTFYIWKDSGELYSSNFTNITGTNYNSTNITLSLPIDKYYWNSYTCADNSTGVSLCQWGSNMTFERVAYVVINYTNESQVYETANSTFTVVANTSETGTKSARLWYNNINQGTATVSSNGNQHTFTKTIDIPEGTGNKGFFWELIVGTNSQNTTSYNQIVNATSFFLCNATYPYKFLNFTFADESNSTTIPASIQTSTFNYWIGNGGTYKSYTYINITENRYYEFCANPNSTLNMNYSISYKKSDYPQRNKNTVAIPYTNSSTNETLYLLYTDDGIYVTFQVINNAEQAISGVVVNGTIKVGGVDTLVVTGTTDAAGLATFWLDPNTQHTMQFTKEGYSQYTTTLFPTENDYTITLGSSASTNNDYGKGITYEIYPKGTDLLQQTDYVFNYTLSSTFWTVTSYGMNIVNSSGTTLYTTSASTNGGTLSTTLNVTTNSFLTYNYWYVVNSTYTNMSKGYYVYSSAGTGFGVGTFFTNLSTHLNSGLL